MLLVPFIMEVGRFWYLLPIIDDVIVTVEKKGPYFKDQVPVGTWSLK